MESYKGRHAAELQYLTHSLQSPHDSLPDLLQDVLELCFFRFLTLAIQRHTYAPQDIGAPCKGGMGGASKMGILCK